ncbi:MAG: trypsin-like peptidase domain-containing protein [Anaerolineaceae bacterium]|nr:trypsin-like peptidase domain-containing protein [Anaerolineaceae bacterium]
MSQPAPSSQENPSEQSLPDPVNTPINIARARYASTYGESVVNKPEKIAEFLEKQSPSKTVKKTSKKPLPSKNVPWSLDNTHSCLFISLLSAAFIVGGILGGVVGGGLLLWFINSQEPALASAVATPTPLSTPTPAPVETALPSPTPQPEPIVTPAAEDVIDHVIPSVVTVINQQKNNFVPQNVLDEGRVVGSGVIIDPRGYIATNNHVVDLPGELKVILSDRREFPAELVAANPAEDLAIVKISAADLPTIEWGNSHNIRLGQVVYAIGSPLGDFPNSVSFGIISGLNRALEIDKFVIDGLIQTDAAINRGSSGGPLINLEGQVIGINTFIIRESEERGVAEGIAFSIPADKAKNLLIPWIAAHTGESVPIPASEESNK